MGYLKATINGVSAIFISIIIILQNKVKIKYCLLHCIHLEKNCFVSTEHQHVVGMMHVKYTLVSLLHVSSYHI